MPACQRLKIDKQRGLLVQLHLPTQKWQSVSMACINFHNNPRTIELTSYDTVLIFTDRATKMVHLIPAADETAKLFIKHVVKHHGIPRSIHSDLDPRLSSAIWAELCQKLDIKHKMTVAYWPQANGQAERTNQTVKQILRFAHDEGMMPYIWLKWPSTMHPLVLHHTVPASSTTDSTPHLYPTYTMKHFHFCKHLPVNLWNNYPVIGKLHVAHSQK